MPLEEEARELGLGADEPAAVELELALGGVGATQLLTLGDQAIDLGADALD
jgi:hypothetical protein